MSSACPPKQKKRWPSRCSHTRVGSGGPPIFRPPPGRSVLLSWAKFPMRSVGRISAIGLALIFSLLLSSCGKRPDPNTLVMIIESSPTNLDPRVGIDGQSERIGELMFDALVHRDEHFNLVPWLAERWEIPDPRTYIFHLHHGVRFQSGQPLTSKDVKWTFDSLTQGKIRSTKAPNYRWVERIETPDDFTVIFHLKEPFAALLWNLSDGGIGIVPYGSGEGFNR